MFEALDIQNFLSLFSFVYHSWGKDALVRGGNTVELVAICFVRCGQFEIVGVYNSFWGLSCFGERVIWVAYSERLKPSDGTYLIGLQFGGHNSSSHYVLATSSTSSFTVRHWPLLYNLPCSVAIVLDNSLSSPLLNWGSHSLSICNLHLKHSFEGLHPRHVFQIDRRNTVLFYWCCHFHGFLRNLLVLPKISTNLKTLS